jgi:hypothetical protein
MEEEENRIIVAPIISDEKQGHFASNIIQTLLGISKEISDSPLAIVWAILLPLLTFLLPLIIKNDPVGYIVPLCINVVGMLVVDCLRKSGEVRVGEVIVKAIMVGMYSLFWSHHIFILARHHSDEIGLFILSAISILTSVLTVVLEGVKEFSGSGLDNNQLGWNSTLYMRFLIAAPMLLAEFVIYRVGTDP